MTRRPNVTTTIPIVWPDGTLVGFMLRVGHQWFGPYITVDGATLA